MFLIFLYGLIIGSFLNALVYRLEKGESVVRGRSKCPKCKKEIQWYDLIPVLSWFILNGRCRYCKERISIQYPLVELTTGLIFGLTYLFVSPVALFDFVILFFYLFFVASLIGIFVYDFKHQIIPDEIIYPLLVGALVFTALVSFQSGDFRDFGLHLVTGLISGGFFYFLAAVSDGKWMGGGDIKLAAFMGLLLGGKAALLAFYFAFILGALVGLILIALGKKKYSSKIPFAPFLVAGTLVSLFFFENIISFYDKMFLS